MKKFFMEALKDMENIARIRCEVLDARLNVSFAKEKAGENSNKTRGVELKTARQL